MGEDLKSTQEYREQEVVRVVPIQPISPEKFREQIGFIQGVDDLAAISLIDIIMIERNEDAPNPGQLLFPGGRMGKLESVFGSAQRELDEEIHASGMRPGMIYEFRDPPRSYHFNAQYPNGDTIIRDNHENWTVGILPPDFYELPLYLADNIARIHRLSPFEINTLFEYGKIGSDNQELSLIDNLSGDVQKRIQENVITDEEETEQLRERIQSEVGWQGRRYKALLAFELAYPNSDERKQSDETKNDLQKQADTLLPIMTDTSTESFSYFDEDYRRFLDDYCFENQDFDISKMVGDAWERVVTRMRIRHFADIPQQGNSLLARLPLDQEPVSKVVFGGFLDELSGRETERLNIGIRFTNFVLNALSPSFEYTDIPKDEQEIKSRLGRLHKRQLDDDKDWEQHVVGCYTEAFGISEEELGVVIPTRDEDSERFHMEYASQLGENSMTPHKVSQPDELKTSNLAALLLFAYKINPYRQDGKILEDEERMAFGARKKLLRIPQWVQAYSFRNEYIRKNTTDGFQMIMQELFKDNGVAYTKITEYGKNVLTFRETVLNHAGVPIILAYQRGNKELYSMRRKADERAIASFTYMTDLFRAAFEIDSTSETVSSMLHARYDELVGQFDDMPPFEDWKKQWEHEAVRTVYAYFGIASKDRGWMYWVPQKEVKDKLRSKSKTGGTRASGGKIEFFKWVQVINRHKSRGNEMMEIQGFPSIAAKENKDIDDPTYALKRLLLANPGLFPLVQLWLDPSLFSDEYEDMMRWLSRQEKNGNGNGH